MNRISRILAVALGSVLVLSPATVAMATDDKEDKENKANSAPAAQTDAAAVIFERSATIRARLTTRGGATSFRFEYGPTTSYGQSTTVGTLAAGPPDRTVTAALEALTPGTVYHFRVIAWNKHGTSTGDDRSFTTTSAVTPPLAPPDANAGVSDDSSPTNNDMSMPSSTAAPEPQLGRSMVVAPVQGTIKVKLPDTPGYATLAAGDSVPVGTLVDTRHGTVKLTSALGAGTTQTGEFRGALFRPPITRTPRHDRHRAARRQLRALPPNQPRPPRCDDRRQPPHLAGAAPLGT